MIQNLDLSLFYDDSFVDFNINDITFNLVKKDIIISTRGGWLDRDEKNVLRAAKIFIQEWLSMTVSVMNQETKIFTTVSDPEEYLLRDIIKFYYVENTLRLIGFGVNGDWVEWKFINAKITIQGDIE